MQSFSLKEIKKAPQTIGVYKFLSGRKVLYIGKAVNLKARLASHLQNAKLDPKEAALLAQTTRIAVIPAPSEFAALLLEAKLIRQERPKYNSRAKDDKSPLYIHVTVGSYPKVLMARGRDLLTNVGGQTFGPFQSSTVAQELIHEIRKVVPFCTRPRLGKTPCFHSKIGQCDPCPNAIERLKSESEKTQLKKQYRKNIRQVIRILKGQTEPIQKDLKEQIREFSEKQNYEKALVIRNRLLRFERLVTQTLGVGEEPLTSPDTQEVLLKLIEILKPAFPKLHRLERIEAYDVSNLAQKQATASMVVVTHGQVDKSQYRKFKIKTQGILGDTPMLAEVVRRRFHNRWPHPDLIVVDGGKPQVQMLLEVLGELNLDTPVVGLAKAPDRLVIGNAEFTTLRLPYDHPGFNLLRLIRDESHRFSRRYHLLLRGKRITSLNTQKESLTPSN